MRNGFFLSVALLAVPASAAIANIDARNAEMSNYKSHFSMPAYKSRKEWENKRARLKQQILSAAGLLPIPARTPLRPRSIRRFDYSDYSIEVVLLETLPGYYVGANVYRPIPQRRDCPAVLVPHGHWKRGRLEDQPSYSVPALGINLARQGYVVLAYDMVGFNDARQTPHSFGNAMYTLWSFHPMGLQLWNGIRALDYLQSLPEVDGRRLAVTGASGGGSQTFFLTAVDDRIKVAAPVNMVSAYMQGGDPCEEAPGLRIDGSSNVEIAAMAAPRPMMLVSSTHDWTRHTPNEEFPAIRAIYELYGRPQNVENAHIDAEHNYNRQSREAVYSFFAAHLQPGLAPSAMVESEYQVPRDEDMLAFPPGNLPPGTGGVDGVFQSWKIAARLQTEGSASTGDLRDALRNALSVEWPAVIESGVSGHQVVLSRPKKHDRITGYWRPGRGQPVLVVHPLGSAAVLKSAVGRELLRSGRPVLIIDPFRPNSVRDARFRTDTYFLSYNRSPDSERVQDIATALAFLKSRTKGKPELIGLQTAGVWSLFVAAIAPIGLDLVADLNGFSGSDEDFRERFFVPGIQRAGGLSAAMKLVNTLRVAVSANTSDDEPVLNAGN